MSNPTNAPQQNGKAPTGAADIPQREHGLVHVQPARLDDLQPRYAQQVQHDTDNPAAHGWYAGFSKCLTPLSYSTSTILTIIQSSARAG